MIAYFDTSSVVPLLVEEAGSERAARLWNEADRVVSVCLVYPEGRAALAAAGRAGRMERSAVTAAIRGLDRLYAQMDVVEPSDALVRRAGALADAHALRGYDAVHLAAAETLGPDDTVVVAGDGPLCRAAAALGLAVVRT